MAIRHNVFRSEDRFEIPNEAGIQFSGSEVMTSQRMCIKTLMVALAASLFIPALAQQTSNKESIKAYPEALNFLLLGDWGQGTLRQRQVAEQMEEVARKTGVDFVVSSGDNIYPSGVSSVKDTLWQLYFERIYDDASLKVPWYPVLGNHDYGGDPEAQVRYSGESDRWKMRARYYHEVFHLPADTGVTVLILFIDTTPLVDVYYHGGLAVQGQDSTAQLKWIDKTLSTFKDADWIFVVGHHPVYTVGERWNNRETFMVRRVLEPLFRRHNINAYLSGHDHNLQHVSRPNGIDQFVSGGGSERRRIVPFLPRRFARGVSGFMLFSVLADRTAVQVINRKGRVLYRAFLFR